MTKHPLLVTLMLWLVLCFIVWNVLRLWTSIAWLDVLKEFAPEPQPVVTTFSSAIWLIVGLVLLWSIWQNKSWSLKLLLGAATGYSVWYWIARLIWQKSHPNWPFAVIVNLVVMIFILFTVRIQAREAYERNIENPTTK